MFAVTNANPSSETVKRMLKSLGLADPFAAVIFPAFMRRWRRPEIATFVQDKLDEIVAKRHAVAHGVDVLKVTRSDFKYYFKFVRILAETLDAEIKKAASALHAAAKVP